MQQTVSTVRLIQHQAVIDCSGLLETQTVDGVKCTSPRRKSGNCCPSRRPAIYTDMQWRSPSKMTGVGVAYFRLPIHCRHSTLIWLAKQEYCKKSQDGELIGQWEDDLGPPVV
jgi:hypothetical protein